MESKSVEDMCRDLLKQAIQDGLVVDAQPVDLLTAGQLVGMANMLNGMLQSSQGDLRDYLRGSDD